MDAARQVKTAMALKKKSREKVDELTAKEEEKKGLGTRLDTGIHSVGEFLLGDTLLQI